MPSIRPGRATIHSLAMIAAACLSHPAHAQGRTAQARGDAEIVGAVSTGAIFTIGTDLLTSIFVTGRTGDTVSIFSPGGPAAQIAMLEDVTILSGGTVSINLQQIRSTSHPPDDDTRPGVVLVLAQFN